MPGAQCTRSLVCEKTNTRVSHHGHTGFTRHSPHNGFTAYFALSPVTRLCCHRRLRIRACPHPVGPTCLRKLDASPGASEPHDFAVRFSAVRLRACDAHGLIKPALRSLRARGRCRVHRIPPRVRDVRTPLCGAARRESVN